MSCKAKKFTLNDGSIVTSKQVAKSLNCSTSTAYNRLLKSSNPKQIYRTLKADRKPTLYTLDDGSIWTIDSLAKYLDIKPSTAASRLMSSNKAKYVVVPLKLNIIRDNKIKDSMYSDPLGHWALINKNI